MEISRNNLAETLEGAGPLGGRNGTFPWACLKVVTMPPS